MHRTTPGGRAGSLASLLAVLLAGCLAGCSTVTGEGEVPSLSDGPLTGKFVWHDLITDDLDSAQRFYGELFGWQFERTSRLDEPYVLVIHAGEYIAGLVPKADPEGDEDYSRWLGYLSVPDVDEAARQTTAAGGRVLVAPLDIEGVARAAAVQDPQGAVLGLLRIRGGDPLDASGTDTGRVVWNELLAADPLAASAYYRDLAGVVPETVQRRGGEYTLLRGSGADRAGILERPNPDITPVWLTHFAVDDPAAAARRAEQLGGTILLAPTAEVREGNMALVEDPNGAVLALSRWSRDNP